MVGVITLLSSIVVIGVIKFLGKRKLGISAMFGSAVCCAALSVYANYHLADSVFSYDPSTFPEDKSVVPLVFFYLLTIFNGFNVSWVILGEVFPFRCVNFDMIIENYKIKIKSAFFSQLSH